MILLEAAKHRGLFRLWNVTGKEVTEALFYSEILKCIVDDGDDWDPSSFDWINEREINFEDWQEIGLEDLSP
ncbi:hypothetical protein [Bacillus sp. 37MA]|uniref:hypothetical protein n=1 Tax=Bacillus sp. 37MA TaxID=1132442 RepID=UPI0003619D31|nr:hypothetical protein [Bacillus sp. 37MA]